MRCAGSSIKACASISRVLYPTFRQDLCHLSGMPLAEHLDRPTLRIATLRQRAAGSSFSGIRGLSARGVYQAADVATDTGGLLLSAAETTYPARGRAHLFILTSLMLRRRRTSTSTPTIGGFPFCGTFRNTAVTSDIPSR